MIKPMTGHVNPLINFCLVKFSLSELGKDSILSRSTLATSKSKHFIIEKQLQASNDIVYIIFSEEKAQYPTYKIENKTDLIECSFF